MAAKQLSDGNSEGTRIGQGASDKLAFFSVTTPIVQPASATQSAITAGATATATTALVIELRLALVNLGLIKGSA